MIAFLVTAAVWCVRLLCGYRVGSFSNKPLSPKVTLRMQALTAARFDDIQAHVSFTGTGSRDSRLYPLWDQTRIWDPGD